MRETRLQTRAALEALPYATNVELEGAFTQANPNRLFSQAIRCTGARVLSSS